jgi:hypothetical protein
MQGYLWIIWVKLAGALWIIGGKFRQLINILFCGYQRLSTTIGNLTSTMRAETYTRRVMREPLSFKLTIKLTLFVLDSSISYKLFSLEIQ